MHISDFKTKLAKINPNLNIFHNWRTPHKSQYIYGLYYSDFGQDHLIGGISGPHCPEFSHYDYETDLLVLRGWRDVLHLIINKGYCSEEKAQKVFKVNLRGDYDLLNEEQRRVWMKKKDGWEDTSLKPGESIFIDKWGKKHRVPADDKIIRGLMRESRMCEVK